MTAGPRLILYPVLRTLSSPSAFCMYRHNLPLMISLVGELAFMNALLRTYIVY